MQILSLYKTPKNALVRFGIFFACLCVCVLAVPSRVAADTAEELKAKIDDRSAQIKKLEEEISQYNAEATRIGGEAKTLQNTVKSLDLTQKKINTDILLTQQKISKANLTIESLTANIDTTSNNIDYNKKAIGTMINQSEDLESKSLLEIVLSGRNIGEIWADIDDIRSVRNNIRTKTSELKVLKTNLETQQELVQSQKNQLVTLQKDLSGKKQAVEATKQEKAVLLAQTKNKEQAYRDLIKTRETQKNQFEKELFDFESQLKLVIDPGSYPAGRSGILAWPLDDVYITQRFGKTVGAEKLYVSGSHNGVDFRASIGTRVKNVLDGVVVGTGNTDIYPGCYSFGKWVMVKHGNGLSTIYGHLSVISVSNGQQLRTGDVIGYSGNTGYSTGPHLHISVYATQGVRIEQYVNSRGCKQAVIPLADVKAYLDPMAYFPSY